VTPDRHKYEYVVDTESASAPAHVVRMVGHNKRVLEVGCGPGSITRILAQQNGCEVTGLELDPDAINVVAPYCSQVIQADLNSEAWPDLLVGADKFDVVIAADVLEHLYDPWTTIRRMTSLLKPDGYLVISLPHAGHAAVMACLFNGDFEYRDWGLLDRTHIRFLGFQNIEALIAQAGLKIVEAQYVTIQPQNTELASSWSKLPVAMQDALMSSKYAEVYQVVMKAVPIDTAGIAITMTPPPLRYQRIRVAGKASWKTRFGRFLSPRLKGRIRKGFTMLGVKL
jgi:2-polyprenyl-3-methyl-5-hydroxy-6-metoxy-1,4-benzoquinol methylase